MTKIDLGAGISIGGRAPTGDTGRVSSTPPPPTRVLVIEDETTLAGLIAAYLSRSRVCHDDRPHRAGSQAVREQAPDVVILDLGLPGLDGIEVCRQIRTFSDCYVIVVTARKDEVDTLIGLSVGADDYVTKPFSVRELLARVQTVLRRPRTGPTTADHAGAETVRVFGPLRVDPAVTGPSGRVLFGSIIITSGIFVLTNCILYYSSG